VGHALDRREIESEESNKENGRKKMTATKKSTRTKR
jgi:hypothetical protein